MLAPDEEAILDLEHLWWRRSGAKEQAILRLGMSTTTYYAKLNALIDRPDALEARPALVRRIRRLRERRLQERGHIAS